MNRNEVRTYLVEHGLHVVVEQEYKGRYFTLLTGTLQLKGSGAKVGYAEAIARCSHLDNPNSNIGFKVALSRLERALVKKHMGHGRPLHHPLYA